MTDHDQPSGAVSGGSSTPLSASAYRGSAPSPWIERYLAGVPEPGPIADVACGSGRHLRLARARGYSVIGIDRDLTGLADMHADPKVSLIEADLEAGSSFPLARQSCPGIIVANYLWRPLLPDIVAAVSSDGVLIYETFAIGNERFGRPSNPDFLLRPGELLAAVAGHLTPIAYEHVTEITPTSGLDARTGTPTPAPSLRVRQRIVAVGPDHIWLNEPPNSAGGP